MDIAGTLQDFFQDPMRQAALLLMGALVFWFILILPFIWWHAATTKTVGEERYPPPAPGWESAPKPDIALLGERLAAIEGIHFHPASGPHDYGRVLLGGQWSEASIDAVLAAAREANAAIGFFDLAYPSPSDPGASFTYGPVKDDHEHWNMKCANHGWSGGTYQISEATLRRQICGVLDNAEVDTLYVELNYFRKETQSGDRSQAEEELLQGMHDGGTGEKV